MEREYYEMPESAVKILKQKKALIIIPPSNFSDEEFTYVYAYLKNAKINVRVASTKESAVGIMGTKVKPDLKLSDVKVDEFDAVLLIGECTGIVKHDMSNNNEILDLLKKADKKKKIVAGTGMAPRIMAAAGIVKNKMLTAWRDPEIVEFLKQSGASYIWEPVVSDENIITADSPSSVRMFVKMLIDAFTR